MLQTEDKAFFFFFNDVDPIKIQKAFGDFGFDCSARMVPAFKGLPFYMTEGKAFCQVESCGVKFNLISIIGKDTLRADALKKMLARYERVSQEPVAFFFDSITRAQQDALIAERIPFVSTNPLIYLPFLGVAIRNQREAYKSDSVKSPKDLPPLTSSAQAFFLFMLYKVKDAGITKAEASRISGFNPMSVIRYSRELEERGLIRFEKKGVSILMQNTASGFELYQKALPYLSNPVKRNIYIEKNEDVHLPVSGESALSCNSMLAAPKIPEFACAPRFDFSVFTEISEDLRWMTKKDIIKVQVLRYDPIPFIQDGSVDPVTLYMSLKDSPDERVRAGLEKMIKDVKW